MKVPTAVQAVAEAHATARSWLVPLVGIGGAFCTVRLYPVPALGQGLVIAGADGDARRFGDA